MTVHTWKIYSCIQGKPENRELSSPCWCVLFNIWANRTTIVPYYRVFPVQLLLRFVLSIIHVGRVDDEIISRKMSAITCAAFASRPNIVRHAVHVITVWCRDDIPVCFRGRTAIWWQALVMDDRYSDPTTSGMCLDNCDCIFLFGAGACPCDVGGKHPSPQTRIVFEHCSRR